MKKALLWALGLVLCAALAIAGGAYWLWQDVQTNLDTPISLQADAIRFEIQRGSSLNKLAQRMAEKGWIKRPEYLVLEARRRELSAQIQAGLYEIQHGSTPRQMLAQFVAGDIKTFNITFIEGSTFADMLRTLGEHPEVVRTLDIEDPNAALAIVAPQLDYAEGWFFPSTYQIRKDERDVDVLARAHARMRDVLLKHWHNRADDLPYESAEDALKMASIIEKETGRPSERSEIAGVFVRRLRRGMKLQTDPTVIYGLGERFDGNLRRVDLTTDTPFNTYTRHGLPPTPIALPGEAAIEAALHPAAGDSLYFVGKGDGSHQFSKTLAEHNAAVRRYQLGGNGR